MQALAAEWVGALLSCGTWTLFTVSQGLQGRRCTLYAVAHVVDASNVNASRAAVRVYYAAGASYAPIDLVQCGMVVWGTTACGSAWCLKPATR